MMKVRYSQIPTLLLVSLLLSLAAMPASAGFIVPKPNPDFVKYLEGIEAGEKISGFIPNPIDRLAIAERNAARNRRRTTVHLPVSYDLGALGRLTDVKDQGSWSTCWDFATIEAMESNWKTRFGEEIDLSELHLGYFAYVDESPDKPAFDRGWYYKWENSIFGNGAFPSTSQAILSRGTGPVNESDAPYPMGDLDDSFWRFYDPKLSPEMPARYRLKESLVFHKTDTDAIKSALMEHGALYVAFNTLGIRGDSPYIYGVDEGMNHAVILVGWDDTISRDLFEAFGAGNPKNDGAWKIQNSYGKDDGDGGFFWISYEDLSIFGPSGAVSFAAMSVDTYDNTYSHDPLGAVYYIKYSKIDGPDDFDFDFDFEADYNMYNETNDGTGEITLANAFTSERDETLVYVGFDTLDADLNYEIQIYKNIPKGASPAAGTPVLASPQGGERLTAPGYRTVKLDVPVSLDKGERFAVAVTFTSTGSSINVPLEARVKNFSSRATCAPGESYYLNKTEWKEVMEFDAVKFEDIKSNEADPQTAFYTNACIKAFTKNIAPSMEEDQDASGRGSSGCDAGVAGLLLMLPALAILRKRREKM